MEIKQLRAVLAIADTGTVTGAAELLHTVQPAISRKIKLLEEELGTTLFNREPSGMVLTEAGRILVVHARKVIKEVEQARQAIQARHDDVEGVVTIGLMRSIYDRYSGILLGAVKERYRRIKLRIVVGYSTDVETWLRSGEVNVALLHLKSTTSALNASPVVTERLCIVGLPQCAFSMANPVPFSHLDNADVFIPGHADELRDAIEAASTQTGAYPRLRIETTGISFRDNLIKSGGFAILPASSVLHDIEQERLCAAPICEPDLSRTLYIAFPSVGSPEAATHSVAKLLLEIIQQSLTSGSWQTAKWVGGH
jgi:LysR family transcriptional regulator, nitrogen assimilation regulatory protein